MMAETSDMELDLLRIRADAAGCYVGRHRNWDPARGGGDLFLQWRRKFRNAPLETILKYATPDAINQRLAEIEMELAR
jgi:hypothetical protein